MLVGRVCRADVTVFLWPLSTCSTCSLRVPNAAEERLFGGAVLAGLGLALGGVWLFRRRCSEVLGACLLDVFAELT